MIQLTTHLVKCAAYIRQHYFYFKFHLVGAVDGTRLLSRPLRSAVCVCFRGENERLLNFLR